MNQCGRKAVPREMRNVTDTFDYQYLSLRVRVANAMCTLLYVILVNPYVIAAEIRILSRYRIVILPEQRPLKLDHFRFDFSYICGI